MDQDNHIRPTGGWAPGLLKGAWFWAVLRAGALAALAGILLTAWGRRGIPEVAVPDPLMYTNLGNLAFWVLWLMGVVLLVPLAGRAWCAVCPVGTVHEVVSRYGLKGFFPRVLRNQNPKALMLLVTVFLLGLYRMHHFPDATAWYLAAWGAGAVVLGLLFSGRSLCAYLCPVGGMLGLYGRVAPIHYGVRDLQVCRDCKGRECVRGATGWLETRLGRLRATFRFRKHPCPVNLKVWDMEGSDRCLLCFNCMRVCPLDNVAITLRRPFSRLWEENYPRFSDTVLLAGLMGFLLLAFSGFWPGAQKHLAGPAGWFSPQWAGISRPAYLLWVGFLLPLLTFLVAGALSAWTRRNRALTQGPGHESPGRFPVRIRLVPPRDREPGDEGEEEQVVDRDTVRGISAVYGPAVIPMMLAAHLVLALVKLNAKVPYLPLALGDPVGMRTYMAVEELGILHAPDLLLPLAVIRGLALAILLAGTGLSLWAHARITGREGRAAHPMLLPLILLGGVVYGGVLNWLF